MSGWTVSAGNVDWVGTLWQTSDGLRTVDMSGAGAGTIHQDVTGFTAGQGYELQFNVAGNTFSTSLKQMQVSVLNGSTLVADSLVTFNNTGKTLTNMGFELRTLAFTSPVSGALRLRFVGINNDGAGVVLDNVRVAETGGAVPEPGSLALLGAGGVAALLIRRKKTS